MVKESVTTTAPEIESAEWPAFVSRAHTTHAPGFRPGKCLTGAKEGCAEANAARAQWCWSLHTRYKRVPRGEHLLDFASVLNP